MKLGSRIRDLRIRKGYTQEELGAKVGVKKAAIQKYENGTVENLKRSVILKLSEVLEVSPAYLMIWDDIQNLADRETSVLDLLKTIYDDFVVSKGELFDGDAEIGERYVLTKDDVKITLTDVCLQILTEALSNAVPKCIDEILKNSANGDNETIPKLELSTKSEEAIQLRKDEKELFELYNEFNAEQRAEIRGEMKGRLKEINKTKDEMALDKAN